MVEETRGTLTHPTMPAAAVEAMLAAPLLHAIAAYARGSVLLAKGDASAALGALRRACAAWRDLEMPYEAARTRVQIALACQALGDHDAADLEFDAARAVFERLGARPDLARMAALSRPEDITPPAELTGRECEMLRLVASGKTNRAIASDLGISEHTVARHLQNIFMKLGLSSRAAATAYAYEHDLI
jgi:DNA-binding NarL/FixJ family response regulator